MQNAISTELLMRLCRATPEQLAAVERILECGLAETGNTKVAKETKEAPSVPEMLAGIHREIAAVQKGIAAMSTRWSAEAAEEMDDEELRKIYARVLLTAKEEKGAREGPMKDVFDFYCLKGFSAQEVAVRLGCSKATVMNRLAALKALAGVPAKQLRAYKPFFEQAEKALTEPKARKVARGRAAYGDAPGDREDLHE